MFQPHLHTASSRHVEIYSFYEKLYTTSDMFAALFFVVGSLLFFSEELATLATWFLLIGSLMFAAKPTARFAREFHLGRLPLPGHDNGEG